MERGQTSWTQPKWPNNENRQPGWTDRSDRQSQSHGWGGNGNGHAQSQGRNGQRERQQGQAGGGYDGSRKGSGSGGSRFGPPERERTCINSAVKSVLQDTNTFNQDKINYTQIRKDRETDERLKAAEAAAAAAPPIGVAGVAEGMSGGGLGGPGINLNYAPMTSATLRLPQGEVTIKMGCVQTTVTETSVTLMQFVTVSSEVGVRATELGGLGAPQNSPQSMDRQSFAAGEKYLLDDTRQLRDVRMKQESVKEEKERRERERELKRGPTSPIEVSLKDCHKGDDWGSGPATTNSMGATAVSVPARPKSQELKNQHELQPKLQETKIESPPKLEETKNQSQPKFKYAKIESECLPKLQETTMQSQPKAKEATAKIVVEEPKIQSQSKLQERKDESASARAPVKEAKVHISLETFQKAKNELPPRYLPMPIPKPADPKDLQLESQKQAALQLESTSISKIKNLDVDQLCSAMALMQARREEARAITKWRDAAEKELHKALQSEEDRIKLMEIRSA